MDALNGSKGSKVNEVYVPPAATLKKLESIVPDRGLVITKNAPEGFWQRVGWNVARYEPFENTVITDLSANHVKIDQALATYKANADINDYPDPLLEPTPPTVKDAVTQDLKHMIIQENTAFIAGTIISASLVIGALILTGRVSDGPSLPSPSISSPPSS